MEVKELKTFSVEELNGRIRQWKEDLFRAQFKAQTNETKDTSIMGKLRKDIARAYTVLNSGQAGSATAVAKPVEDKVPSDKPAKKPAAKKKTSKTKGDE